MGVQSALLVLALLLSFLLSYRLPHLRFPVFPSFMKYCFVYCCLYCVQVHELQPYETHFVWVYSNNNGKMHRMREFQYFYVSGARARGEGGHWQMHIA